MAILEKIPYIFEGLDWWLEFGTLLGLVREGKIIDWDNDLDIGVMEETMTQENIEKIKKRCEEFGFYFFSKDYNGFRRIYYSKTNGLYCDIWTFKKDENNMIDAISNWTPAMHDEKFTKNKDILIRNNISYNIPSNVNEFLRIRYGNWQHPRECRRSYKDGRLLYKENYEVKLNDKKQPLPSIVEDHKKNKY